MFGRFFFSIFFFLAHKLFALCELPHTNTPIFPKIGVGIPFPFPTWKEKTPVITKAVTHEPPTQTRTFPLFPSIKYTVVGLYHDTLTSQRSNLRDRVQNPSL